jgi:hypothetical protein
MVVLLLLLILVHKYENMYKTFVQSLQPQNSAEFKSAISESSNEMLGAVRQVNSWSAHRRFSDKIIGQGINVKLWAMHLEALEYVRTEKPQDFINIASCLYVRISCKKKSNFTFTFVFQSVSSHRNCRQNDSSV